MPPKPPIHILDHQPSWATHFAHLHSLLFPSLSPLILSIEHVGSTSVPGLAAKPVLDVDIVIESPAHLPPVITALSTLGYTHRGDLGIPGRHAFRGGPPLPLHHHLYVCVQGNLALRNHLALRDYLRAHPQAVYDYSTLKQSLARRFPLDMQSYISGKTDFILTILHHCGFPTEDLAIIRAAN